LDAIRHDPKGGGNLYVCNPAGSGYNAAFPDAMAGMGCGHLGDHDGGDATPDQAHCHGYELTANLDFDTDGDGDGDVDSDDSHPYQAWDPMGNRIRGTNFSATFDGRGHTIFHLTMNRNSYTREWIKFQGLFSRTDATAIIRNVGLLNVSVSWPGRDPPTTFPTMSLRRMSPAWWAGTPAASSAATPPEASRVYRLAAWWASITEPSSILTPGPQFMATTWSPVSSAPWVRTR
jgi:hypothetical protein